MDDETREALDNLKGRCQALESLCSALFIQSAISLQRYAHGVVDALDKDLRDGERPTPGISFRLYWLSHYAEQLRAIADGLDGQNPDQD